MGMWLDGLEDWVIRCWTIFCANGFFQFHVKAVAAVASLAHVPLIAGHLCK